LVNPQSTNLRSSLIKKQLKHLHLLIFLSIGLFIPNAFCQTTESDSVKIRRFDIFPAISYTPETNLTLGALGYLYPNFKKEDPETVQSYINFLALYTFANQLLIETNWEFFTDGNKMRFIGGIEFARYPNRNYGLGNDADSRVIEYELFEGQAIDSTINNYKRYSIMWFNFNLGVLRELTNNLYGGGLVDVEYVWNFEELADRVSIVQGKNEIDGLEKNALGLRAGLGLNLIWDSRNYILSSSSGSFINLSAIFYGSYLGSKYDYYAISMDARTYLNPVGRHTLALRGVVNLRGTNEEYLPLRGVSKIGGSNLVRGYFNGTFQNNNMMAFEAEYRIPFWKKDKLGPIYHYWKRLAMTVFASGAQVFGPNEPLNISNFNFAVGAGLRILFNEQSRTYLRIDYAFGLRPNAGGPGQFQRGLYFTFGEAF
jgi:outer membrane protein assembly factor BamA